MVLSCSKNPFSSSTEVGQKIVDDFDPGITDINSNIKMFSGEAVIDSSFSMRDIDDSILPWSHRNMAAVAVGTFSGVQRGATAFHDTAYAYIEFRPGIFRQGGNEGDRNNLKSAYSIDSVVFTVNRFRMTIDSASSGRTALAEMNVFECDTMKDSDNVSLAKGKVHDSLPAIGTFSVSLDSAANDTVYSVKLDASYKNRFQRAVGESGDTAWFAFCLKPVPSSAGVARFDNSYYVPRISVFYRKDSTDSVLRSVTLNRHHASFTVFEQDSVTACGYPFASWGTGRRAVLKLGVSSLREYMDTAAGMGKKFVVIQRADLKIKLPRVFSDLHSDSVQVFFCIFDTLAHTMKDFTMVTSFFAKPAQGTDTTYTLPVAAWLQKTIIQEKSDAAFLYLMVPPQSHLYSPPFIQLDWTQPGAQLKLQAIVTNPR